MKRGTMEHPKFIDLMVTLGRPAYVVAGILESLWYNAAKYYQQGNVGKFSNEAIARMIGWEGDPDALVGALARHRWLDHDSRYRLTVHGWDEHADGTVRKYLQRNKLEFIIGNNETQDGHQTDMSGTSDGHETDTSGNEVKDVPPALPSPSPSPSSSPSSGQAVPAADKPPTAPPSAPPTQTPKAEETPPGFLTLAARYDERTASPHYWQAPSWPMKDIRDICGDPDGLLAAMAVVEDTKAVIPTPKLLLQAIEGRIRKASTGPPDHKAIAADAIERLRKYDERKAAEKAAGG